MDVLCPDTGCNTVSITNALQESANEVLNTSIENGQLLSDIQNQTNNAVSSISGATLEIEDDSCSYQSTTQTETDDSTSSETRYWYPVWGGADKCSNAPGMPYYMQDNTAYITSCKYHLYEGRCMSCDTCIFTLLSFKSRSPRHLL